MPFPAGRHQVRPQGNSMRDGELGIEYLLDIAVEPGRLLDESFDPDLDAFDLVELDIVFDKSTLSSIPAAHAKSGNAGRVCMP